MQCIHNNYTCNMHTYKVTINCTAGCQHSKFITSYLPISDPFSALCCSLIHLMDCLSLYLCILSVMYSEVVITWLESRNLAELFMIRSLCKFIQLLTMICCMDRIFIGLVYSLVPWHTQYYKVMFTHLRQSQTSQYQTIFSISPHLHFRWCYLWSKTWCVWYSDIMVAIGPAYFFEHNWHIPSAKYWV